MRYEVSSKPNIFESFITKHFLYSCSCLSLPAAILDVTHFSFTALKNTWKIPLVYNLVFLLDPAPARCKCLTLDTSNSCIQVNSVKRSTSVSLCRIKTLSEFLTASLLRMCSSLSFVMFCVLVLNKAALTNPDC